LGTIVLFSAAAFLGASVLFVVEPMMAKMLLPPSGGTAGVWTTSVLFFQLLLTAGYAYTHGLSRRWPPRTQVVAHLGLMLAVLLALPVQLRMAGPPPVGTGLVPWILVVLGLFVAEDGGEEKLAYDLGFGVFVGGDGEAGVGENGFADDDGGSGLVVEVAGVGAGDLEAVEERGGSFGVDAVLGHGGDEHGEGELDGFAIFERGEVEDEGAVDLAEAVVLGEEGLALHAVEMVFGDGVEGGGDLLGGIDGAVAAVGIGVEVAEDLVVEGGRAAAGSVGVDVTADLGGHGVVLLGWVGEGYPPPYFG